MSLSQISLSEGSALCLDCGFCCQAVLHMHADLTAGEIPLAQELGLEVTVVDGNYAFQLPCQRFEDGKCSTYTRRPDVCAGYRCRLLQRYLRADLTLEIAQMLVYRAKRRLAAVESCLGPWVDGQSIWRQVELWCANAHQHGSMATRRRAEPLRQIVRLAIYLQRHFVGQEISNPIYTGIYWTIVSRLAPTEVIESILGRAVSDIEFRRAVCIDSDKALACYDLSREEQFCFKATLDSITLETMSSTLAARLAVLKQ